MPPGAAYASPTEDALDGLVDRIVVLERRDELITTRAQHGNGGQRRRDYHKGGGRDRR